MQAAAARARRLLGSPAASGLPGILSGPRLGRASCAEGVLLPRLDGIPASPLSPHHARGFSSYFASQSPGNLLLPTMASQGLSEKSVCYHMATAHFSTKASDVDQPTDDGNNNGCDNELNKYDPRCGMSKEEFEWRCTQHKRLCQHMPQALRRLKIQSERMRRHFLDDPDALKVWDEYAGYVNNTFTYNLPYSLSSHLNPPDSVLYSHLMKSKVCSKTYVGMLCEGMDKLRQIIRNTIVVVAGAIITFSVAAGLASDQWKKQHSKET